MRSSSAGFGGLAALRAALPAAPAPAPIPAPAPRPGVIRRAVIACHPAFAETAAAASADSPPIRVATARRERVVLGD